MAEKLPYWKFSSILRAWIYKYGPNGCELCTNPEVKLSITAPPPPLEDKSSSALNESPLRARHEKQKDNDPYVNVLNGVVKAVEVWRQFDTWMKSPDIRDTRTTAKAAKEDSKKQDIPKFDIAQIPRTIQKLGMPKAAVMMDKWFQGKLNYSKTPSDSRKEINQDDLPYPDTMFDTTSITMDWVLTFKRARKEFEELKSSAKIATAGSIKELRKIAAAAYPCYRIDAWQDCNQNIRDLHRKYQFQFAKVEGTTWQKFHQYAKQLWSAGGVPDELTLILGSFNIYAAVAYADISFTTGRRLISITHVYMYVRDGFTFTDEIGQASQYLGHWSAKGVAIVILKQATVSSNIEWVDVPTIHDSPTGLSVMYPVKNSDFRNWQLLHQRGGDYIIFTDPKLVKLQSPIVVDF